MDLPAVLQNFNLAGSFIFNGTNRSGEAVHILHLHTDTKFRRALWPHRYIDITADRTLLHLAVGDTKVLQSCFNSIQIRLCLGGGAHLRLGNDLDKRNAAAVKVNQTTRKVIGMNKLTRVLLNVDTGHTDALGVSLFIYNGVNITVFTQRNIKLRNLIRFGQIGIKVVFAVHLANIIDAAMQRIAHAHGIVHHTLI